MAKDKIIMEQQLLVLWIVEEEYLRENSNEFSNNYALFQKYSKQEEAPYVLADFWIINREDFLYDLNRYYDYIINNLKQVVYSFYLLCIKCGIPRYRPQIIMFCDCGTRETIKDLCFDDESNYRYYVNDNYSIINWATFFDKTNNQFDPGFDVYGHRIPLMERGITDSWLDRFE